MVQMPADIACIDEIDKMSDSVSSSMHEAMASQRVQIHKADIHTRLPARTAVLAAGNPRYGRFDEYEPINEQVELGPTLLSRFDLIFTERDEHDREKDQNVGGEVIKDRGLRKQDASESHSLSKEEQEEKEPPLSTKEVRAYIALARQTVTPVIEDEEIEDELLEVFVELREAGAADRGEDSPVLVTMRTLEALHRLAEASARVRLSETIERVDVKRAKRLMLSSMREVGVDPETGEFDAVVIETGASKTQRDRQKLVRALIEELEAEFDDGVPIERVIEQGEKEGVAAEKIKRTIERCKQDGHVYEPAEDTVRWSGS